MSRITLTKLRADTQEYVKHHVSFILHLLFRSRRSAVLGDAVLRPPLDLDLDLQFAAVAEPLDHLQVSPALLVEGRVPAHDILVQSTNASLRNVPHDFIQVVSRHS